MHDDGEFGRRLRQLRRARDLTQEALAQAAFCSLDTIKKLESGRRRPSRQLAAQLAAVLTLDATERPGFLAAARASGDPNAALESHESSLLVSALRRSNLPAQLTPFLGRAHELAALAGLLAQPATRLITIIGHGGMGKTRLALALGEQLVQEGPFADGVCLAALAPLSAAAHLEPALADALGFPLSAGGPQTRPARQQLCDYLQAKRLLLVLDNCEHLREGVCDLATTLLAAAPGLQILATSRERLDLPGEQRFPLGGLSAEAEADGVALFAVAAARQQPTFELDGPDQATAAQICQLVGGMPLAIELAAGWVDTLPLGEIAAAITQDLGMLEAESAAVPVRQRSIRAIFATTWQQLDKADRAVFAQLAVFRGGCTARAVQAITGASLAQLRRFVGRSLIQYDPARDRYGIHELLRQYAAEQLAEDSAAECSLRERHGAYYLEALAAREVELKGAGQQEALDAIARDSENLRVAWGWAVEMSAHDLLAGAVGALSLAYEWLGRSEDGLEAMQAAAAAVDAAPALRATLLVAQARFAFLRGARPGTLLALLDQAQSILKGHEGAEVDLARAHALLQRGHGMANKDYAVAHDAYTRSLALFVSLNDRWGAATALAGLGLIAIDLRPDYAVAQQLLEQSVAAYRLLGEQIGLGATLTTLSQSARYLGNVPESLALAQEAYTLAQATGNPFLIAQATSNLGISLYWAKAYAEAYETMRTALTITLEFSFHAELANCYYRLGNAAQGLGRYSEARVAYTRGLAAAQRLDDSLTTCFIHVGLSRVALAEGVYDEALSLAKEAITVSTRLGEGQNLRFALRNGALAARRLGEMQQAKEYVLHVLRLEVATSQRSICLGAAALLLADSGAPEYVAALFDHAGWTHQVKSDMDSEAVEMPEIRAIRAALPPDILAAAQARWAGHDYRAMLAELLAELEAEGWGAEG